MGGGGFTMEPDNPALDDFVLSLTEAREPRILFLPTASGDPAEQIRRSTSASAAARATPSTCRCSGCHGTTRTLREIVPSRTSSTSAAARCATCWPSGARTGSTTCLREAWERGIVLAG